MKIKTARKILRKCNRNEWTAGKLRKHNLYPLICLDIEDALAKWEKGAE